MKSHGIWKCISQAWKSHGFWKNREVMEKSRNFVFLVQISRTILKLETCSLSSSKNMSQMAGFSALLSHGKLVMGKSCRSHEILLPNFCVNLGNPLQPVAGGSQEVPTTLHKRMLFVSIPLGSKCILCSGVYPEPGRRCLSDMLHLLSFQIRVKLGWWTWNSKNDVGTAKSVGWVWFKGRCESYHGDQSNRNLRSCSD